MATFKTIRVVPEDETINVTADVDEQLHELVSTLSEEIGFVMTPSQVIAWLLKRYKAAPVRVMPVAYPPPMTPQPTPLEQAAPELARLCANGMKINAIKLCREVTGWGLKESKDYVEKHWQHLVDKARADGVSS